MLAPWKESYDQPRQQIIYLFIYFFNFYFFISWRLITLQYCSGSCHTLKWISHDDQPRQHIKKQRHYFVNKGRSSQGYVFSSSHVWMWVLDYKESWASKNWWFSTVVLEKTLENPLDRKRSNQSILKEISPEYSLEGLMLKLKFQYFGHLMQRADSFEKTLMLGKIEGRRRRVQQRMRWSDGITDSVDMSLGKLGVGDGQGGLVCCGSWGCRESGRTERLNWTDLLEVLVNTTAAIMQ